MFDVTKEATKLSEEDIEELPVRIMYSGPVREYSTDEKRCYEVLMDILDKFNLMQNPEFYSFPLGRGKLR